MRFILSLIVIVFIISLMITPAIPKIKSCFNRFLHKIDGFLTKKDKMEDK